MLKQITPLGTTVKERASPSPGQKNWKRRSEKERGGEGQAEILILSPLARFMSGFRRNTCRFDTKDGFLNFTLEANAEHYEICLSGRLNLQDHSWSISWEIFVNTLRSVSEDVLVELVKQFLKKAGASREDKDKQSLLTLVLQGEEGVEMLLRFDRELAESLKHLLMQVVVLADLPDPVAAKNLQHIFHTMGDDYQALRKKCSFYFPWTGMEQLKITLMGNR